MRTAVVVLSLVLVTACGTSPAAPPEAEPTPSSIPASPTPEPSEVPDVASVDLAQRVPPTELIDGWSVESCDPGDAPLLCVFRDGQRVGTIEWSERFLDLETGLREDLERMPAAEALAVNLERAGFYEDTEADRRDNCEGRSVEWERPVPATVAGTPGMVFSYTVPDDAGAPQDVIVSYQGVNADQTLFIVVAEGLGPRTCIPSEGVPFTPELLREFRPVLDGLVARMRLPSPSV